MESEFLNKEKTSIFDTWKEQYSYSDLIEPIRIIFQEYFEPTGKKYSNGIKYSGLPLFGEVSATNINIKDKFSKKGIKNEKEQGRDLIDIILHTAFLYGYSARDYKYHKDEKKFIDLFKSVLEKVIKENEKLKKVIDEQEQLISFRDY